MGGDKIVQISVSDQTLTLWQHEAPIRPTVVPKIAFPIFFGQHAEKNQNCGQIFFIWSSPSLSAPFGATDLRPTSWHKKFNVSFSKLCKNICGTKQIYEIQEANLLPIIKVGYKTSCRHNCLIYLQKTKGTLLVGSKVVCTCTCTEWFSSEGCRPYLPSFPAAPARQLR